MPGKRTTAAQVEARRDQVMAMVLAGGTVREIGRALGVHYATVARDVEARLHAMASECPNTAKYREIHRQRINDLLKHWWPRARSEPAALDRVIRLLEREARLLGLDAPVQHEVAARVEAVTFNVHFEGESG